MKLPPPREGRPRTAEQKETVALRDTEALHRRKRGESAAQIAEALGYKDEKSVYGALRRQLRRIPAAAAEDYRKLQDLRCDDLLSAVWPDASTGNLSAVDRAVAIERFRAELFGTYAPKKQEVTGEDGGPIRFTLHIPKNDPGDRIPASS